MSSFAKANLLNSATIIRNAKSEGFNTAQRVGKMFIDIIEAISLSLTEQDSERDSVINSLKSYISEVYATLVDAVEAVGVMPFARSFESVDDDYMIQYLEDSRNDGSVYYIDDEDAFYRQTNGGIEIAQDYMAGSTPRRVFYRSTDDNLLYRHDGQGLVLIADEKMLFAIQQAIQAEREKRQEGDQALKKMLEDFKTSLEADIAAERERAEAAEAELLDGIDKNAALLAEANIRVFDSIILHRNFLLYPALSPGDIVYSVNDNGFYRYSEKVTLEPFATGVDLPGGSISTPKFTFMPYEDYMDGDAPDASILFRMRSTSALYRYDAATASLVQYADGAMLSETEALVEDLAVRVSTVEAGVARLAPVLERARLRRSQRVPHLCTGRISINSVPGNVYRNKGFVTICRGIPYVSETPFYMYNYKQGAGKEYVDIARLLGYTPEVLPATFIDDVIERLYIFTQTDPRVAPRKLTECIPRQDLILHRNNGIIGFSRLDLSDLLPSYIPERIMTSWALAMKVDDMMPCGGSARHVTINKHGAIVEYKGAVPDRFKLGSPVFADTVFSMDDGFYHSPTEGWKRFAMLGKSLQMQHSYNRHIVYLRHGELKYDYWQRVWNPHLLQQQIKGSKKSLRVRIRNKSLNGNVSDWIYCVLYKTDEPTGVIIDGQTLYKNYIVECPEDKRMGLINSDSPGIEEIGKLLNDVVLG